MSIISTCEFCSKQFEPCKNAKGKFCSIQCQANQTRQNSISEWKEGKRKGCYGKTKLIAAFLRAYLFNKYDKKCSKCSWGEANPTTGKIPLEVNHIDGNAENCVENNLELVCPNCHSLTSNFRNLNKGNGSRIR